MKCDTKCDTSKVRFPSILIVIKRSSTVNKEVIKKGILSIRNKAVNTE